MLAQAIEAEVEGFLADHAQHTLDNGHRRVVRNGYLPEREIQTGIGPVSVRMPRTRDKGDTGAGGRIRFTSKILPPYLRRTKSIEELIPWLYLKGISTGDFSDALASLLGPDAPGLSASTIGRLKDVWKDEMAAWQGRDLSQKTLRLFLGRWGLLQCPSGVSQPVHPGDHRGHGGGQKRTGGHLGRLPRE